MAAVKREGLEQTVRQRYLQRKRGSDVDEGQAGTLATRERHSLC